MSGRVTQSLSDVISYSSAVVRAGQLDIVWLFQIYRPRGIKCRWKEVHFSTEKASACGVGLGGTASCISSSCMYSTALENESP